MLNARTDRPQPIAFQSHDVSEGLARLRADTPILKHGRDALTLVRDPALDLVLIALSAAATLPNHRAPGPISVLVLSGVVRFTANGESLELEAHELITLPAWVPHEIEALIDSAILVTIVAPITHRDAVGLEAEDQLRLAAVIPPLETRVVANETTP